MNPNKPLSIGFIGGSIASAVGHTHKIACEMDNRWKITAGCFSRQKDINAQTAQQWNLTQNQVYHNWQTLLEEEQGKLDAVAILTPTPSHYDIVIKALELGYPVICEKALTSTIQQAKDIALKQKKTKGFLAITYNYSGYPIVRELRSFIQSGQLGAIQQIHIEMPQDGFIRLTPNGQKFQPQGWRLADQEIPTITLDLGAHTHHLVNFLTGATPKSVVSMQSSLGHFPKIIDNVMCMIRYSNSIQCNMWYSKTALGHRNGLRIRVYGEKASAEWYQLNPEEFILNHCNGTREIIDRASHVTLSTELRYNRFKAGHPAGFIEAFANLYSDMADSLLEFKATGSVTNPFVYGIQHAIAGYNLFDAMNRSAKINEWVNIQSTKNKT